jgi:carbon starvation protein CstA
VGAIAFAIAVVDTATRMHRMLLADADAEPIPHANTLRVAITIAEPDIDAAR